MNRRGYFFVDAIVALGLITGVALVLLVARSGSARVSQQVGDQRAAVRIAERYLIHAAAPAAAQPAGEPEVAVSDLPTAAPADWKWVRVRAVVNGRAGEVVGLVRRGQ